MDPCENTSPSCVALTSPPQPSTGCTRTFVSCIVRTDRDSARAPLRERETDRQTDRQTETDRETERQRQTDRERDRDRDREREIVSLCVHERIRS